LTVLQAQAAAGNVQVANLAAALPPLRRSLSRKLNNLLQGKAWIDSLSVKPREP